MTTRGAFVPAACLFVYLAAWIGLAIEPRSRATWALENVLSLAAVITLVATHRRFRFSDRAYVEATALLLLHTVGSHYEYSHVPAGDWLRDALALSRNHYDRLVHFAFGLLAHRGCAELTRRASPTAWRVVPVALLVAVSALYEIVEWLAAITVDPAAGTAFVGVQGDPWDAQKDMALAALGAVAAAIAQHRAE